MFLICPESYFTYLPIISLFHICPWCRWDAIIKQDGTSNKASFCATYLNVNDVKSTYYIHNIIYTWSRCNFCFVLQCMYVLVDIRIFKFKISGLSHVQCKRGWPRILVPDGNQVSSEDHGLWLCEKSKMWTIE